VREGLKLDDIAGHTRLAESMAISFGTRSDGSELVTLAGRDVTQELRSELAGQGASRVAAWPEVRAALLGRQRAFCRPPGLVADGRDMGTVVFPQADLKIYLTATPDERALRRYKQLKDKGSGVSLAALSREIAERDLRDSTRKVSPLKAAADAHVIDSTELTIDEVVNRVLELGRNRTLWG
jgi:cytidylate kinase